MTGIVWDEVGKRTYQSGVQKAVLYLPDGSAVPWNGIKSVTEKTVGADSSPLYYDGVKYSESTSIGYFAGTLKAYTYPDEFLPLEGVLCVGNGLYVTNQEPQRFGLSYQTNIGNDVDGANAGYKLHILYNLTATPSDVVNNTSLGGDPIEFEWDLVSIPGVIPGYRPTAHLIFDSREMGELLLSDIERTLYGDEFKDPRLPDISTLVAFTNNWVIIRITDNLDGTWTATGPDELFTMLDATTFQIIQANAVYLDSDTYAISDSTY